MYDVFVQHMMNKIQTIKTFLILRTVVAVRMIGLTSSNTQISAGKDGYDEDNIHINWKKFKNSNAYEEAR